MASNKGLNIINKLNLKNTPSEKSINNTNNNNTLMKNFDKENGPSRNLSKIDFLSYEYKLLRLYSHIYGIYSVPQPNNLHVWDGVLFLRAGLYKDAKFKFVIQFDKEAAIKSIPTITFKSKVYHPLVNYKTGELDMRPLASKLKPKDTFVDKIYHWLKSIFHDLEYLQYQNSFNQEAADKFMNDIDYFYSKIQDCIEQSHTELPKAQPTDAIKFTKYDQSRHKDILDKLHEVAGNKEISSQDKMKTLIGFTLKHFDSIQKQMRRVDMRELRLKM